MYGPCDVDRPSFPYQYRIQCAIGRRIRGDHQHRDDDEHPRAVHYKNATATMDRLIDLWNLLDDPMPRRPDQPPTAAVRNARADRIDHAAKQYRTAYREAYGNGCFKPYTHMVRHLGDCQRRVQYDLHRYSCQSQEHYGKIAKTLVKTQTNFRLGKKNMKGKFTTSYIEQVMRIMVYRKKLNMKVPVRKSEYSRRKNRQRQQQREQRRQAAAGNAQQQPQKKAKVERKSGWSDQQQPMAVAKAGVKK